MKHSDPEPHPPYAPEDILDAFGIPPDIRARILDDHRRKTDAAPDDFRALEGL